MYALHKIAVTTHIIKSTSYHIVTNKNLSKIAVNFYKFKSELKDNEQ